MLLPHQCGQCGQEEQHVARVHRVVVRDREFPEKVMVDHELVQEIVKVLEGSTSFPDWMLNQDSDVLTFSLMSAFASSTGSSFSPAASKGREA